LEPINCRVLLEPLSCRSGKLMVQVTTYRSTRFDRKLIYRAWDNLRDEEVFFTGIHTLEKAGIPPSHVRAYMLIGFDKHETWDRIWYRFHRMVERGIEPYPMVFHRRGDKPSADLKCFQRWTNRGLYRIIPWVDYRRETKSDESVAAWRRLYAAA
jgi:hypothetical protein